MEMCLTLKVEKQEISKLADKVTALIHSGIYNIDIVIDKHWQMSLDDMIAYERQLMKISRIIYFIKSIKREFVCINVLTDIFSPQEEKDAMFTMCKGCPCTQCKPNPEVFKEFTGFANIPFKDYCRKSFVEMLCSGALLKQLKGDDEPIDWSDITEEEWFELQLLKGAQHELQTAVKQSDIQD